MTLSGGYLRNAKNIAIRVDATQQIGTGHFMRCLTLADTLKQRGAQIRFVSRDLPAHLRDMLAAKDMELVALQSGSSSAADDGLTHSHWLGTSQALDAQATIQALSGESWDWLVVDHYALDMRWESALRRNVKRMMVIDDIADRQHDCDVLLDQNFYVDMQTRYNEKVPEHCQLLLGPRYALLREEFRTLRGKIRTRTGKVQKILVFFGGVDTNNYTGRALEVLAGLPVKELHIDVVIGAQHPHRVAIEKECKTQGYVCHVQTTRMAELMAAADLAVGAGGSATWERCCMGLPTLAICTADNQQKQISDAACEGLLYAPGTKGDWHMHILALVDNSCLRQHFSYNSTRAVDGRGTLRVVENLGMSDVEVRVARLDDSQNLFQWRNHPAIREVSRNTNEIDWHSHQNWFASVLADTERILLIGQRSGNPVGVVRFDVQNDEAEISIYLVPDVGIPGLGRALLLSAEQWLAANHPAIQGIRAHVLGANDRSKRLFIGAGYQVDSADYSKRLN